MVQRSQTTGYGRARRASEQIRSDLSIARQKAQQQVEKQKQSTQQQETVSNNEKNSISLINSFNTYKGATRSFGQRIFNKPPSLASVDLKGVGSINVPYYVGTYKELDPQTLEIITRQGKLIRFASNGNPITETKVISREKLDIPTQAVADAFNQKAKTWVYKGSFSEDIAGKQKARIQAKIAIQQAKAEEKARITPGTTAYMREQIKDRESRIAYNKKLSRNNKLNKREWNIRKLLIATNQTKAANNPRIVKTISNSQNATTQLQKKVTGVYKYERLWIKNARNQGIKFNRWKIGNITDSDYYLIKSMGYDPNKFLSLDMGRQKIALRILNNIAESRDKINTKNIDNYGRYKYLSEIMDVSAAIKKLATEEDRKKYLYIFLVTKQYILDPESMNYHNNYLSYDERKRFYNKYLRNKNVSYFDPKTGNRKIVEIDPTTFIIRTTKYNVKTGKKTIIVERLEGTFTKSGLIYKSRIISSGVKKAIDNIKTESNNINSIAKEISKNDINKFAKDIGGAFGYATKANIELVNLYISGKIRNIIGNRARKLYNTGRETELNKVISLIRNLDLRIKRSYNKYKSLANRRQALEKTLGVRFINGLLTFPKAFTFGGGKTFYLIYNSLFGLWDDFLYVQYKRFNLYLAESKAEKIIKRKGKLNNIEKEKLTKTTQDYFKVFNKYNKKYGRVRNTWYDDDAKLFRTIAYIMGGSQLLGNILGSLQMKGLALSEQGVRGGRELFVVSRRVARASQNAFKIMNGIFLTKTTLQTLKDPTPENFGQLTWFMLPVVFGIGKAIRKKIIQFTPSYKPLLKNLYKSKNELNNYLKLLKAEKKKLEKYDLLNIKLALENIAIEGKSGFMKNPLKYKTNRIKELDILISIIEIQIDKINILIKNPNFLKGTPGFTQQTFAKKYRITERTYQELYSVMGVKTPKQVLGNTIELTKRANEIKKLVNLNKAIQTDISKNVI